MGEDESLGGGEAVEDQPGAGKSASLSGGPNEGQAMTDTTNPNHAVQADRADLADHSSGAERYAASDNE